MAAPPPFHAAVRGAVSNVLVNGESVTASLDYAHERIHEKWAAHFQEEEDRRSALALASPGPFDRCDTQFCDEGAEP